MNTFLPYADFAKSAAVLDDKRLYKQIVECKQILNTLRLKRIKAVNQHDFIESIAWENHPAVLMWEGYEYALRMYQVECLNEWAQRRWQCLVIRNDDCYPVVGFPSMPTWFGDESFHRAMRSNLKRKDPQYYGPLFEPDLPDDLPYVWPVQQR